MPVYLRDDVIDYALSGMYRRMYRTGCLAVIMTSLAVPQDIDTVISRKDRRPFTVLDQIEDRLEKAAFRKLYNTPKPDKRMSLAQQYLRQFPQSWLLAQVYEIAAKAAMDLEDYPAALDYGRQSLRLLPENPFLLVPLANIQAKQDLWAESTRNATAALRLLDRFDRPALIREYI